MFSLLKIMATGLRRGAPFSLALRHGRSYDRKTRRCLRPRLAAFIHRARLSVVIPVGSRPQDPQLRRLLLYPTELPDRPFCVLLCLPWESKADAKIRVILGKTQNFLAEQSSSQSSSHSAAQHCLFTASPADGRTGPHGGRRRGHEGGRRQT